MAENLKSIVDKSSIPDNFKYYWGYQYMLGVESIAPYIEGSGGFKSGDAVVEVGSAEGGVLHAFVERGASRALGTDIVAERLEMGRKISAMGGMDVQYSEHNILTEDLLPEWENTFDLALLRDVIEHLDETEAALRNISKFLKPGGRLFVTFPPYNSPFGGHQHTLGNLAGKIPYIHLLPFPIFNLLTKSGRPADRGEVIRLRGIRLSPAKFTRAARSAGYEIVRSEYYLLRPVFKMKFGLPALRLTPISFLPLVKSFFSLEAAYLLRKL